MGERGPIKESEPLVSGAPLAVPALALVLFRKIDFCNNLSMVKFIHRVPDVIYFFSHDVKAAMLVFDGHVGVSN